MSTNNTFKNVDDRTDYLMHGFIRLLHIFNQIIPTSVIEIIIRFYGVNTIIFYLEEVNNGDDDPIIRIAQLDTNIHSQCIVKPLDDAEFVYEHFMETSLNPVCYDNNFVIPSNVLSVYDRNYKLLNKNQSYHILFSLANNGSDECVGYIVDPTNMATDYNVNAYYWKLPNAPKSLLTFSALYSSKHGLISMHENDFFILKLDNNQEIENEFKWKSIKMATKRCASSTIMISKDEIFCCGAYEEMTEIYDFNRNSWRHLAEMNHERWNAGICYNKFNKNRVYVGGGKYAERTFEYYETEKNEWYLLPKTNGYHERYPIVWQDNMNIINIASTFSGLFEQLDVRENKWNKHEKIKNAVPVKTGYSYQATLDDLFGTEILSIGTSKTRFIVSNM